MTTTQRKMYGFFPLWGATFDSQDSAGIVGADWTIRYPSFEEWRFFDKTDVWKERVPIPISVVSDEIQSRALPACLITTKSLAEGEDLGQGVERLWFPLLDEKKDALLSLRLLKPGWFLDPEFSFQTFTCEGNILRAVGPYRQLFLAGIPEGSPRGYDIKIGELSTTVDKTSPTLTLWNLLRKYRAENSRASIEIAVENFHRSYGFQLSGSQRAFFLFTALDALLGRLSAKEFGRVKFKTRFRSRLEAALHIATKKFVVRNIRADEEAGWLDTEGRVIRNDIAHGNSEVVAYEAGENYERLQNIVRMVLRQSIEFANKWAETQKDICGTIQISTQATQMEAYNRTLDLCAQKSTDALNLLDNSNGFI